VAKRGAVGDSHSVISRKVVLVFIKGMRRRRIRNKGIVARK